MSFKQFLIESKEQSKGIVLNIEDETVNNKNYRKVIWTGKNLQLVLMSLKPNEEIGEETHNVDQFFRIDGGSGTFVLDGQKYDIKDGFAFTIPANVKHNVIAGSEGLKVYTIYTPPHHKAGLIEKDKSE